MKKRVLPRSVLWPAVLLFLCFTFLAGCSDDDDDCFDPDAGEPDSPIMVSCGFDTGLQGWEGDFADYTFEFADMDSLVFEYRDLPEELNMTGDAPYISGRNTADDLFMFMKRSLDDVEGIEPDTTYAVDFHIEFATNTPSGCVGIGGAPGEAVRVKVGATAIEPEVIVEDEAYRMNIVKDVGMDPETKTDMVTIGDVGNTLSDCTGNWVWEIKTLEYEDFEVTTDGDGELWLIVGTDSGFEGTTSLYYTYIEAILTPVE